MYPTHSMKAISEATGIPYGTLNAARHRLGLSKSLGQRLTLHPVPLTGSDLSYFAGLVDGEGTVTVRKLTAARRHYVPLITICNTSDLLLTWMGEHLGSCPATWIDHRTNRPPWRDLWVWAMKGLSYLPFYRALNEHLVIKRPQMDCVIEFCEIRLAQGRLTLLNDEQERLISRIRELNKRGLSESVDVGL